MVNDTSDFESINSDSDEPTLLAVSLQVEPTSDIRVDSALARMQDVSQLPTEEHIEIFDLPA